MRFDQRRQSPPRVREQTQPAPVAAAPTPTPAPAAFDNVTGSPWIAIEGCGPDVREMHVARFFDTFELNDVFFPPNEHGTVFVQLENPAAAGEAIGKLRGSKLRNVDVRLRQCPVVEVEARKSGKQVPQQSPVGRAPDVRNAPRTAQADSSNARDCAMFTGLPKVPLARLTLHCTKLCTKFKIFRKKIIFGPKVTSEAFSSISQNLKVTRLQEGTQTKL
jgi:hypothetical protein